LQLFFAGNSCQIEATLSLQLQRCNFVAFSKYIQIKLFEFLNNLQKQNLKVLIGKKRESKQLLWLQAGWGYSELLEVVVVVSKT